MSRRVIAIVGPTAVGKTDLSVDLAGAVSGQIVNVDSRQVYRGMDVGTGKPSVAARGRVPHHLFDLVDPNEDFSLARYLDEAREAIERIFEGGSPVILVGGTGQYLWALVEGWTVPRVPPNREFRLHMTQEVERKGTVWLHSKLEAIDPTASRSIHPNNLRRIIRALEVIDATGRPFSEQRLAEPPPWDLTIAGLTLARPDLDRRIRERIDGQIDEGWPDEVRSLVGRGFSVDLPSFGSLGYREISAYISGEITQQEAADRIFTSTRRFTRRQRAWFSLDDRRICWIDQTGSRAEMVSAALSIVGAPPP